MIELREIKGRREKDKEKGKSFVVLASEDKMIFYSGKRKIGIGASPTFFDFLLSELRRKESIAM